MVNFGPEILLPTQHGNFHVKYVTVSLDDSTFKEGVLLKSEKNILNEAYVRIQSSCLFSESFWATDCDCALQLQEAMKIISEKGGYLLYFYEEGRGAGLNAKFRAIELQQLHNYDTKTAYECLNMKSDERNYRAAAEVLRDVLKNTPIILLTNNEGKLNGLMENGLLDVKMEPLVCGLDSPSIKSYLQEKKKSLGHLIP